MLDDDEDDEDFESRDEILLAEEEDTTSQGQDPNSRKGKLIPRSKKRKDRKYRQVIFHSNACIVTYL